MPVSPRPETRVLCPTAQAFSGRRRSSDTKIMDIPFEISSNREENTRTTVLDHGKLEKINDRQRDENQARDDEEGETRTCRHGCEGKNDPEDGRSPSSVPPPITVRAQPPVKRMKR